MTLLQRSIQTCLTPGLLVEAVAHSGIYWTPSVATKLTAAKASGVGRAGGRPRQVALTSTDMIVGTYHDLDRLRSALRAQDSRLWAGTDIHHIVENQHLRFLAVRDGAGAQSYRYDEPCVLLVWERHRLLFDSLIGLAVKLEGEAWESTHRSADPFTAYKAYRKAHPVPPDPNAPERTRKARHCAGWVSQEWAAPGSGRTRAAIGALLLDAYGFAYHQSHEALLGEIAAGTIRAFLAGLT